MANSNINSRINSLSTAKTVNEIENGVMLYEFNSEAETEAAVIECIEKGVKFNTTGRRSLVVYQPAPAAADEYAVTYCGETIAATASEAEAHEIAKGEAEAERTTIEVIRKSDNAVIAVYDFSETPTTDTTDSVTITISKDDCNLYVATANGVHVGSINRWFNNAFEARYTVDIKQRKALAMPELQRDSDYAQGFMLETDAVLWLGDMLVRYFKNNGVDAKVVNA